MKTETKRTWLAILLRAFGVIGMFALIAVVMPMPMMARIHEWLGLGEMPSGSVVEYLARSLSAFYAVFSAICLFAASDLSRYLPLVRLISVIIVLLGAALLCIDLAADMPTSWTLGEGPPEIAFGVLMFWLAREDQRQSDLGGKRR